MLFPHKMPILVLLLSLLATVAFPQSMDDKIKTLANEIADQVVKNGCKKVAVTTLDYKGCNTEFGKFLAEELTGNLSVSGRSIAIVNQQLLESLLAQNRLTARGLLEAKNDAAKLGEVSGIDALVYGTITTLGEDVRISLNVVRLPTLTVFGYAKGAFSLTNGIKEMLPCNNQSGIVAPSGPGLGSKEDPDKRCRTNHTGTYCFQNTTNTDIRITTTNADFTIHPGQTECNYGMSAGSEGEYAYMLYIYRNAKENKYESRQIVVSECQVKTYVVR